VRVLSALALVGLTAATAPSPPPDPLVPAEARFRYELYFPSPQAEQDDRERTLALADRLGAARVDATTTATELLAVMRRYDDVLRLLYRHGAYLTLRASENVGDRAVRAAADALDERGEAAAAALRTKLARIDDPRRARLEADEPALRAYDRTLREAREAAAHEPPAETAAAGGANADTESALLAEYRRVTASASYPKISTAAGELDPRDQAATANPDRAVRRAAAQARASARSAIETPLAAVLVRVVRLQDAAARRRRYDDAPARAYARVGLTPAQVRALLDATARDAGAYREYRDVLTGEAARRLAIADVRSYDLGLPPAGVRPPVFTLADARTILPRALAPLGAEYVREYAALLDPRNGRLDVTGGTDRDETGYSLGFPGTVSALYLSPYRGTLSNLRALIHEGGHATHRQLMNQHGVVPVNASGPNGVFEAIAIFNELLLYDDLQRTAPTPAWRAYYLERFLDDATFQVYGSAEETALEEAIHRGVVAGTVRSAADLDALTLRVLEPYEPDASRDPERRLFWTGRSLFWRDPLYSVNYLYAGVLAAEFYRLRQRDPVGFAPRYTAFLANGFTDEPAVLLHRFLGIDATGTAMVDDAAMLVREKTAELRAAEAREP
jgi:oligoendopeptidase F